MCPLRTHLTNKIVNINGFGCFDHIQHCKYSNERPSSTHASTKLEQKLESLNKVYAASTVVLLNIRPKHTMNDNP